MGYTRAIQGALLGVDTTARDVWGHSASRTWPTAAETIRIASGGNANDTAAGSGARVVTVEYLDENWEQRRVTIATNGASASAATTVTAIRVQRAWVSAAGAYTGVNAGAIVIEGVTSSAVLAVIAAGESESNQSHYTIPAGMSAALRGFRITVGGVAGSARFFARENADVTAAPFAPRRLIDRVEGLITAERCDAVGVGLFPEKTDLWWQGVAGSSTTNVGVSYVLELRP